MNKIFNNLEVYGTGTTNDSNAIKIFNSNSDELFSVSNSGVTSAKTINVESLRLVSQNTRGYLLKSDEQGNASWNTEQTLTLWPLVVQGNRLIDGSVSYVSGLTFDVSTLKYIIDGLVYEISSTTQVTLSSGDSVFDRIDVIFADISGNTGVLEGTPSSNPEKPIVDSNTQVEITFVSVPSNSTTPTISTKLIYDEKVGQPTEWNFSPFGSQSFRISGDSTLQSYSGTKSISVSGITSSGGSYSSGFILSATTPTDTNQYATLQFAIRNMSGNSTNTYVLIQFLGQTGNLLSSSVWIYGGGTNGQYVNYVADNTSSWQLISIPLWRFYLNNTNVYGIKFSYYVPSITPGRHYFDKIELVQGTASSPPTNSWTTIQGDNSSVRITAQNPNSTLRISGGTNISSTIVSNVSPQTVRLDLDDNITLNGVTATGSMIYSGAYVTRRYVFQGTITNAGVNISHNLNVNYVVVQVYDNSSPNKLLAGAEIVIVDNNTINIKVSETATYNVIIIG